MAGRRGRWVTPVVLAAIGGVVAMRRSKDARAPVPRRRGTSAGGMDYLVLGDAPRVLLSIPGGPGSEIPAGILARLAERESRAYLDAGYAVWSVTRRRDMPPGHSVADMADDHARFIREELGGFADVVLGQSYGGMIALYLAGRHPGLVGSVVLAGAAATLEEWGRDVDVRWARLRAEGRHAEAGAVFLEYFLPGPRYAALRRLLGPAAGSIFARSTTPPGDLLVEADAERAYDARELLGRIDVPVLLVCGEQDRFFSMDAVRQTAAGCADSTVISYPGRGHVGTLTSGRLPEDVVAWLARRAEGLHPSM